MVAGERVAGTSHEEFEQAEFFGRERNFSALTEKFVRHRIKLKFAESINFLRLLASPTQKRVGTCQQLFDAEGLGYVVIGTEIKP